MPMSKEVHRISFYTRKVAEFRKIPLERKTLRYNRLMAYKNVMNENLKRVVPTLKGGEENA
jgi:hypothetical protein